MPLQLDLPIQLPDGAILDIGVVNGKVCLLLKVTDPAQVIQVDAATTGLAISLANMRQINQRTNALIPVYNQISLS